MAQIIDFEGAEYEFPDDATDAEITTFLRGLAPQPPAGPPQAPIAGASSDDVARGLAPPSMLSPTAGGPQPTISAPRAPERGTSLSRGVQGVGGALADLAGMPFDLGAAALNAGAWAAERINNNAIPYTPNLSLPRVTDPVMGGEWIRRHVGATAENAGFPVADPEALSWGERATMRGIESVVNAVGGGQMLRGLGRLVRGPQTPGARPPILTPIERSYAERPGRMTVMDTGAGAGMAGGREISDEYGPRPDTTQGMIARLVAEFVGGAGGATAMRMAESPRTIASVVDSFMRGDPNISADPATGLVPRRGVADEARTRMQASAVDPRQAATTIDEGTQFYRERGMPVPTTGLLSNDEGLIGLERGMRGNDPTMIRRDRDVAQGAADQLGRVAPDGVTMDPLGRDEVRRRASERMALQADRERQFSEGQVTVAEEGVARAGQAEQDLAGQVVQRAETRGPAAQRVDSALIDETMQPMQAQQRALYAAVPDVPITTENIGELVRDIRASVPRTVPAGELLPAEWLATLDRLTPQTRTIETGVRDAAGNMLTRTETTGGTVGFAELDAMRPPLSSAISQANRAGNFALARNLERLRRHIDTETERLAASGGRGAAEAQAATRFSREEIAPRFGQQAPEMADLRERVNADPRNRSEAPRERTAETFLGPQANEGAGSRLADQMTRALRGSPSEEAGRRAARDYVLADMRSVVNVDGRVNPARLEQWIQHRTGVLRAFPEINDEIVALRRDVINRGETSNRMARELAATRAQHDQNSAEAARNATALFLDADPMVAVERVFSSPDPAVRMREIVQRLRNDPEAMRGWRTAVADHLERANTNSNRAATAEGSRNVSGARLENMLTDHRLALEALYGAGSREMQALEAAHRAVTDMMRLGVRGVQGSETAPLLERILNAAAIPIRAPAALGGFGAVQGGMIMRNLRTALGSVPALNNEQAVQRILRRAQLDPDLASHLLRSDVTPRAAAAWNRRLTTLLAIQDAEQGR